MKRILAALLALALPLAARADFVLHTHDMYVHLYERQCGGARMEKIVPPAARAKLKMGEVSFAGGERPFDLCWFEDEEGAIFFIAEDGSISSGGLPKKLFEQSDVPL